MGQVQREKGMLEMILAAHPAMFGRIVQNASSFRFQVLASEVVEDNAGGPPQLVRHGYRVDEEYFYPASAIKICGAVAAVQKVKHLRSSLGVNVTYTTPIALYPLFEEASEEKEDPSNLDQRNITIVHEIRKLFLVSDNVAFNRLFDFVGHHTMNRGMWSLGLFSTRLRHRLSEYLTIAENQHGQPIGLEVPDGAITLPPKKSSLIVPDNSSLTGVHVGTAYITEDGEMVPESMDFAKKNYMSLLDLQNLLVKLVRSDIQTHLHSGLTMAHG